MIVATGLTVVFFEDLDGADKWNDVHGGFARVSYGDAEYTLVKAQDLAQEIRKSVDKENYQDLLAELDRVPELVYVALDG